MEVQTLPSSALPCISWMFCSMWAPFFPTTNTFSPMLVAPDSYLYSSVTQRLDSLLLLNTEYNLRDGL